MPHTIASRLTMSGVVREEEEGQKRIRDRQPPSAECRGISQIKMQNFKKKNGPAISV